MRNKITKFHKELEGLLKRYNATIYVDSDGDLSTIVRATRKNEGGQYALSTIEPYNSTEFYGIDPNLAVGSKINPKTLFRYNVDKLNFENT